MTLPLASVVSTKSPCVNNKDRSCMNCSGSQCFHLRQPSNVLPVMATARATFLLLVFNAAVLPQTSTDQKFRDWQARDSWFYGQRTFPGPSIPPAARLNSLRHLDNILAEEAANGRRSVLQWTQIGPMPAGFWNSIANGGSSGRVTALAVDP